MPRTIASRRQARARLLVERAAGSALCKLSIQNLGEFFNVVTRKIKRDPLLPSSVSAS